MTTTFAGLVIENASPQKPKIRGALHWEIEIEGATETKANAEALAALAGTTKTRTLIGGETSVQTTGTKGTLILEDGQTITNCAILDGVQITEQPGTGGGLWKFTLKLVKDCAPV